MKLTNISTYPVTVNGHRIESHETEDIDIDHVEYYENDNRFLVEVDDTEDSDDRQESKPEENTEKEGDS